MPALDEKGEHALAFFKEWLEFTKAALAIVAPNCPITPQFKRNGEVVHKCRPWGNPGDGAGPVGLIYHYTAGPNGIASMRWGNENPTNSGSSWHCTVLDHRIDKLEEARKDFPLVRTYLPVTAFLHADIKWGTWHGNWTNSRTFGLENRNVGYVAERDGQYGRAYRKKDGSAGFRLIADQKRAVLLHGRWWESYTREQLIANINIGKMLRAWRGCNFDPTWVLPHSAIWWGKSDVGPAYPMELVRDTVFSDIPTDVLQWLNDYTASATVPFIDEEDDSVRDTTRAAEVDTFDHAYEPLSAKDFDDIAGTDWRDYLPALRDNFRILGYYIPHAEAPFDERQLEVELRWATRIFQTSTQSPSFKGAALKVDGVPGQKTREAVEQRLRGFGWDV